MGRIFKVFLAVLILRGTQTHVSAKNVSQRVSGPHTANQTPPKLTEDDYVLPRQAWLNAHHSPLDARAIYRIAEKEYHLDSDFVIAVAFAETNGGTVSQRGSGPADPNYWSLCSQDSVATTCHYRSQSEAVDFFGKTFGHNALLGKYTKVSELSRAHNPHQAPIYASSNYAWNKNVIQIMGELKGKKEADYVFRL